MTALLVDTPATATGSATTACAAGGGLLVARSVRNRKAMVGLVLFLLFCVVAIVPAAVHLGAPPERRRVHRRCCTPSGAHLLGTTALGQDIWAQLVYGTRQSLVIALVAGLVRDRPVGADRRLGGLPRRLSPTTCCR